ncbi:condensation domain-containing protein [Rhizocola hellebori]|nr:condensation domain-containing protein [Rhizocola hellebori]
MPLSLLQQRFWYLCTAYPGDASPILFLTWRIRGPLDPELWSRAVSEIVNRHESLRTGFTLRDGQPVQVIYPGAGIDTDLIDLRHLPEEKREDEAQRLVTARTHTLLDLTNDPLVSSCFLRLDDDHHIWCFTMHHLVSDGASLRIVGREMRTLIEGGQLPALTIQYGDFAAAQEPDPDHLAYWVSRLEAVPPLNLPTDHPRPAAKGTNSAEIVRQMDGELAAGIARLAKGVRGTPFMVLLAGLQALLSTESGQTDFCVGSPVAGRTRVELEPLVGLFANTLALRTNLSGDPTFQDLLGRTRETVIGALRRQSVPFGQIVARLDLPKDPSRTQVFQAIFSMRNDNENKPSQLGELWVADFPHGHPKVLHDLVVDVWRLDAQGIRVGMRYDTDLFSHNRIVVLLQHYESLLQAVIADPHTRLSMLSN